MKLEDFIGNRAQVESITAGLRAGRIANAYLLAGPAHVGKRTLSLLAAKILLCKNSEAAPCHECSSCKRVEAADSGEGFHPDLTLIEPQGAFIKISQIRDDLIVKVRMPPSESARQVFIVNPAERMNAGAANAFLKSLEEAPGRSVFFLVSNNQTALLPTIRSRCQIYNFQRPAVAEIRRHLEERQNLPDGQAELIARLSQGAPGVAMHFDLEGFRQLRSASLQFVRLAMAEGPVTAVFDLAAQLNKEKESFPEIFDLAQSIARDIMIISSAGPDGGIINIDLQDDLLRLAEGRSPEDISSFISEMAEAMEPLNRNVRIDTISENLMISGRRRFR